MKTLQSQNQEQKTNHEIIIQDLMNIQTKAQDTIDKLGKIGIFLNFGKSPLTTSTNQTIVLSCQMYKSSFKDAK